jgi:acyl CoA:acetate/3-ketoacid CoA transferase alpha subunit
MSLTTTYQAANDASFRNRVAAAVEIEAWQSSRDDDALAQRVRAGGIPLDPFVVATAVDYRDAYAYASEVGNPDPGRDPSVITDGNISAAVQAHWSAIAASLNV